MRTFLMDEDVPRSTAKVLREMGFAVLDARDCGLRGRSDDEVFKRAQKESATILTEDVGFANLLYGRRSGSDQANVLISIHYRPKNRHF
jgi:predicted nuclease of predicted toxin-antitoxin system